MKKNFVLVLTAVFTLFSAAGLFAGPIKFDQKDHRDSINVTAVSTAMASQVKIEYTAKKDFPVMTILIKCIYKDGSSRVYDNEERNVRSGNSRQPLVVARSPSDITKVELSFKEYAKKDIEILEKTEEYLDTISKLFQAVPSNRVQEFAGHIDKASNILGTVNKGMDVYKVTKDMSEIISWGRVYKDAKTDEEKIRAGNSGNRKFLETIPKLAAFAGGPLYGQIIPVVCKMVSSTYNILDRRAQGIDLTWWYEDDKFYQAYYGNEKRFGNLVLELKSRGATVNQVTEVLNEFLAIEQMTGQQLF
jgi:hypothetical protein